MTFEKDDLRITLKRYHYRFYDRDSLETIVLSGEPVMEIYYSYDHGKDWGFVEDEYITIEEAKALRSMLMDFMSGKSDQVEINFSQDFRGGGDFLAISVKRVEEGIRFRLLLHDMFELLEFEHVFSGEEWAPYYHEFLTWGEALPFEVGDEVKTLVQYDEYSFWKGRCGKVYEITPPEPDAAGQTQAFAADQSWSLMVCFVEDDLPKPWLNGRMYYLDEVEKLKR